MRIMFGHSVKRLMREGAKSLSVPLIALVLVILINLLGGIRSWLEDLYEDTLENFPIVAVVSDLTGANTEDLHISMRVINLFTDPELSLSLERFTKELSMRRTLEGFNIPGHLTDVPLIGITGIRSDPSLDPEYGVEITFFEGFDESSLLSDELVSIVSEDIYAITENDILVIALEEVMPDEIIEKAILPEGVQFDIHYYTDSDGKRVSIYYMRVQIEGMEDIPGAWEWELYEPEIEIVVIKGETVSIEKELTVIGTVSGAGYGMIYIPFWVVSDLALEMEGSDTHTEVLNATLRDNRVLSDFKEIAGLSFPRTSPFYDSRQFAMTVYDSEFYETLEPLRQNIIVIDVATPFIYILSIAVGFLTSVLLTRRRKAEFAIMRSIGVSKWVVFTSALMEQATLSIAGAALGFAFVAAAWGYTSLSRPAVFIACYLLGAIFAAFSAAGTNVMKVLRDRRE